MKTTPINARCPVCDAIKDRATSNRDDPPEPGSISLCANCGGLSIFTDRLELRPPTPAEAREILTDPELIAALNAARADMPRLVRHARRDESERN